MILAQAQMIAGQLVEKMAPFCETVRIAGSIRRGSPEVKDIELTAICKWEDRPNTATLFSQLEPVNLLHEYLKDFELIQWIKPGTQEIIEWPIRPGGKYWRGLLKAPTIKLDLFLATPGNFGVIYTIRTGSADFSRGLVTYARDHTEYRVDGGDLKYRGEVIPCPDEETLFASLNLRWIAPQFRRGKNDLEVL